MHLFSWVGIPHNVCVLRSLSVYLFMWRKLFIFGKENNIKKVTAFVYIYGTYFLINIKSYFFNWHVFALQCCVSFCCATVWISCVCVYIPSLPGLLPHPLPQPSRSSQSTELNSLGCTEASQQLVVEYLSVLFSRFLRCDPESSLCICISVPDLQTGASVPLFRIPCMCTHIRYGFSISDFTLYDKL